MDHEVARFRRFRVLIPREPLLVLLLFLSSTLTVNGYVIRPGSKLGKASQGKRSRGAAVRPVHNWECRGSRSRALFSFPRLQHIARMGVATSEEVDTSTAPQVWASSVSIASELGLALHEAASKAVAQLPKDASIDLALVHVSSIYGNAERLEKVVPELRKILPGLGVVIGCSSAGVVGMKSRGRPVEIENRPCVGLTLATLPDVKVQPFYLNDMDVPDPLDPPAAWKRAVKMGDWGGNDVTAEDKLSANREVESREMYGIGEPIFLVYVTPQSIDALGDYIAGMDAAFPRSGKIGAIASTVSSLTKSCVFFGESGKSGTVQEESSYYREGMVGVSLTGDIRMRTFVSQGARRIGPTFHADQVDGPVVKTLRVADRGADGEGQDDWVSPALPPLAMIKQVQKRLTVEDQRLLQANMLVGIAPELIGDTPEEVRDISKGMGRRFVVQSIVRKSVRDGSIIVGSDVPQGTRLQFFVRDKGAARSEFNSGVMAYKRQELMETLSLTSTDIDTDVNPSQGGSNVMGDESDSVGIVESALASRALDKDGGRPPFRAAGALMFPGLDRGRILWDEDNYQSSLMVKTVPVPLGGFFSNGVAGSIAESSRTSLFGSSTGVAVFSPITARRTTLEYSASDAEDMVRETKGAAPGVSFGDGDSDGDDDGAAIVSDDSDDFVVLRRDINSGRPVVSGPVHYSVAESVPQPRNSLEALVWEKEAEVDRYRDRWPMSLLVSRVKMFNAAPENKPRDLVAALAQRRGQGGVSILAEAFACVATASLKKSWTRVAEGWGNVSSALAAVLPLFYGKDAGNKTSEEILRTAPSTGPIRSGPIDVVTIASELENAGVAAIAVNTDRKFFGCTYEDLTEIKEAVKIPVMCSDVVVYPYQLYQARLAGSDAVKLFAPALPDKDLMYFHKIAAALGMQSIVAVSSIKQMLMALRIPGIRTVSINNRNMATWVLDKTRVSRILGDSKVQEELKAKDVTLVVEAGLDTKEDIAAVKAAGISCVVVGEAILREEEPGKAAEALLR